MTDPPAANRPCSMSGSGGAIHRAVVLAARDAGAQVTGPLMLAKHLASRLPHRPDTAYQRRRTPELSSALALLGPGPTAKEREQWVCPGSRDRLHTERSAISSSGHPLPESMLYAEPLRRRMRVPLRVTSGSRDSERVVLLHEPGRYPVAYFPVTDIARGRRCRAK